MSAALSDEDFDVLESEDEEELEGEEGNGFSDEDYQEVLLRAVKPSDVFRMYQALYNTGKTNFPSVEQLSTDEARLAFQVCHEMNQVDDALSVTIADVRNPGKKIPFNYAVMVRAVMFQIALEGMRVQKANPTMADAGKVVGKALIGFLRGVKK